MKATVSKAIPFIPLLGVLIYLSYGFFKNWIERGENLFISNDYIVFLIPSFYFLIGYLTIYFPFKNREASKAGWPRFRFFILVLLFLCSTSAFPVTSSGLGAAYLVAHLVVLLYFLVRFSIAQWKKTISQEWRWYYLVFLWSPAAIILYLEILF